MAEFLSGLAGVSLGGGLAVALTALATRIFRARFAARWRCWVWLALCLRLAIPFSLPELPELAPTVQLSAPADTVIYSYVPPVSRPQVSAPASPPAQSAPAVDTPTAPAPGGTLIWPRAEVTLYELLGLVWALGAAGTLLWLLLSHLRFVRYVERWSRPVTQSETLLQLRRAGERLGVGTLPELRLCPGLTTPMLAGLSRPVLLLPEQTPVREELDYSLLHELAHGRRRDIWRKALALWVSVLHWFNPCMWYLVRLVERDTELACDETVLAVLPRGEHAAYGKTILNAAAPQKGGLL